MRHLQGRQSPFRMIDFNIHYEHHQQHLKQIKHRKPSLEKPIKLKSQFRRLELEKWIDIYERNQRLYNTITNTKSEISKTIEVSDFLSGQSKIRNKSKMVTLPSVSDPAKPKRSKS